MWLHKEKDFKDTRARLEAEGFAVKECHLGVDNDLCWLIFPPHAGIEWNEDNLIYRSSVWTDAGEPVSLGWKKFFNWDESPDLAPKPTDLKDCSIRNKEDGTCLIMSRYKGEWIMRTRGSINMDTLDNGWEKSDLAYQYRHVIAELCTSFTASYSLIFEWVTPSNRIVIDYGDESKLILTGIISHGDYGYMKDNDVDDIAQLLKLERPKRYKFDDIVSMEAAIKSMIGIEGVCIYYNDDQDIKKLKTEEYLRLHSIRFGVTYKDLINISVEEDLNTRLAMDTYIIKNFDYEGLLFVRDMIGRVYDVRNEIINQTVGAFCSIPASVKKERKDFAQYVLSNDATKEYSAFMFKMWEGEFDIMKTEKFRRLCIERYKEKYEN